MKQLVSGIKWMPTLEHMCHVRLVISAFWVMLLRIIVELRAKTDLKRMDVWVNQEVTQLVWSEEIKEEG